LSGGPLWLVVFYEKFLTFYEKFLTASLAGDPLQKDVVHRRHDIRFLATVWTDGLQFVNWDDHGVGSILSISERFYASGSQRLSISFRISSAHPICRNLEEVIGRTRRGNSKAAFQASRCLRNGVWTRQLNALRSRNETV
jgi:hypothetical protein